MQEDFMKMYNKYRSNEISFDELYDKHRMTMMFVSGNIQGMTNAILGTDKV